MGKKALLLIDIQNIYFTEGSYLLYEPQKAAKVAGQLLAYFRENNLPVIHVQNSFNTKGYSESKEYLNDFYIDVAPLSNEKIVKKGYPSSYLNTDLHDYLIKKNIDQLVIAGMMSHMCVDTTVRVSQNYGYQITLIKDACTTTNLYWEEELLPANLVHKVYMASLNGTFANVISLNEFFHNN